MQDTPTRIPGLNGRRVLRTKAAADYLGLSTSTLEKMRIRGQGPRFLRLGGRAIGYEIQALDEWLRECAAASEAD